MNPRHVALLMWKEFLQLRRDPLLIRVVFAIPVAYLILFGYVVASEVRHLPTAIVDLDRSPASRQLAGRFEASSYFDVRSHPDGERELQPLLDRGDVRVAVVIPAQTQASLDRGGTVPVAIIVDGSDAQSSALGTSYATRVMAEFNDARRDPVLLRGAPGVDLRVRVLYNQNLAPVNAMIPGLIAAVLMISIMVVMSQAVVKERERGTLEQLFTTPVTRAEYLAGKVTPYAVLSGASALITAVLGAWWFRVPFHGSILVIAAGLGLFMLTCLGLGLFVSLVSHTRHQAQQAVVFMMLPTFLLSGFIFPIESMPTLVQPITRLIPMTYAVEILRGSFVRGSTWADLSPQFGALALFAAVLFGAAVIATGRRLAD